MEMTSSDHDSSDQQDHLDMQRRVKEADQLLARLFQEYDDGKQPDWEVLRDVPGTNL